MHLRVSLYNNTRETKAFRACARLPVTICESARFNKGLTASLPLLFIGYTGASPISTREKLCLLASLLRVQKPTHQHICIQTHTSLGTAHMVDKVLSLAFDIH